MQLQKTLSNSDDSFATNWGYVCVLSRGFFLDRISYQRGSTHEALNEPIR